MQLKDLAQPDRDEFLYGFRFSESYEDNQQRQIIAILCMLMGRQFKRVNDDERGDLWLRCDFKAAESIKGHTLQDLERIDKEIHDIMYGDHVDDDDGFDEYGVPLDEDEDGVSYSSYGDDYDVVNDYDEAPPDRKTETSGSTPKPSVQVSYYDAYDDNGFQSDDDLPF